MAFVPFTKDDQPTMAAFNERFQQAIDEAVSRGVKIEVGSYVGTGTYGSSNPNTLTLEFEPKLIVITEKGYGVNPLGSQWNNSVILVQGSYSMYVQTSKLCKFNVAGKNATWYTEGSAGFQQLNSSGTTYNYIAIG